MSKAISAASLGTALFVAGLGQGVWAQDNNASIHGNLAGTYQAADESGVHSEGSATFLLSGSLDMGPGSWHADVRGSTTPRTGGVAGYYGSNALVGETLDSDGDGRIAMTQLFYQLEAGPRMLRFGLLDPTDVLDTNAVANDEFTQFMADNFVNNASIGFPSYVLGAAFQAGLTPQLSYRLFVGSDSGLEDNTRDYHNVFDITGKREDELGNRHRKGMYTAAELGWQTDGLSLKGGVWFDTGRASYVDGSGHDAQPYGFYASAGMPVAAGRLNARVGFANDNVQEAGNVVSVAYQLPYRMQNRDTTMGFAVARVGDSGNLSGAEPIYQAEAYWRIHIASAFYVTPDVQYIRHPQFNTTDRGSALVGGVRIGAEF